MSKIFWIGLAFTIASGLANLLGGYLAVRVGNVSRERMRQLIAAGAGFLLAAAFLDLIPGVAAERPTALGLVLVGYLAIYVAENFFSQHAHETGPDCEGEDCHEETHGHAHQHKLMEGMDPEAEPLVSRSASLAAAIGLGLHAFFDGVALMSSFGAGMGSGVLLFVAISMHKLPAGFSLASVMRAANYKDRVAVGTAAMLLGTTTLGAIVAGIIGAISPALSQSLIALAAGSLVYIGATDMIPMSQSRLSRSGIAFALGGAGIFFLSLELLHMVGLG